MPRLSARGPWVALAVGVAIVVVLMGLSVADYLSLAEVHAATTLRAEASFEFVGLTANGTLPDTGAVRMRLTATVANPSSRLLVFDTIIYRAWVEDGPVEAGVASRADVPVANGSTTQYFFLAFNGANVSRSPAVLAGSQATAQVVVDLTSGTDPAAFAALQNITAFASSRGIAPASVAWLLYAIVSLDITDMPSSAASTNPYLMELGRVILVQGEDIGA